MGHTTESGSRSATTPGRAAGEAERRAEQGLEPTTLAAVAQPWSSELASEPSAWFEPKGQGKTACSGVGQAGRGSPDAAATWGDFLNPRHHSLIDFCCYRSGQPAAQLGLRLPPDPGVVSLWEFLPPSYWRASVVARRELASRIPGSPDGTFAWALCAADATATTTTAAGTCSIPTRSKFTSSPPQQPTPNQHHQPAPGSQHASARGTGSMQQISPAPGIPGVRQDSLAAGRPTGANNGRHPAGTSRRNSPNHAPSSPPTPSSTWNPPWTAPEATPSQHP